MSLVIASLLVSTKGLLEFIGTLVVSTKRLLGFIGTFRVSSEGLPGLKYLESYLVTKSLQSGKEEISSSTQFTKREERYHSNKVSV